MREERGGRHTFPEHLAELLPHRQQQHLDPELGAAALAHAERPRAALDVAGVLPHGADAALEEVDRVLHLQVGQGELVDDFPECLDGDDVFEHAGQAVFVGAAGGLGAGGGGGGGG